MSRIIGAFLALSVAGLAATAPSALPLVFEPNRGQADKQVEWLARGPGYTLFLTQSEAVVALRGPGGAPPEAVRMRLAGSRSWRVSEGLEPTGGISNYFLGDDPTKWRTGVPHYRRVKIGGVYAGVDLTFYGNPQELEYDLVVEPGADPEQIRLDYDGMRRVEVDPGGGLVLTTQSGAQMRQPRPRVYQEVGGRQVEVVGGYVLRGGRQVSIQVPFYDRGLPLVIDPVLVYSTYLGGSAADTAHGLAVDSSGAVYIAGSTASNDFPLRSGFQSVARGLEDVFVSKLNSAGNALVYSTYLGGLLKDQALGLAVDSTGSAYVTGSTLSADFPTQSPYQTFRGAEDVFVAKLNPAGSALLYSTYLGGGSVEYGRAIAVDSSGAAYVAGTTNSSDFPTQAPYQTSRGQSDVFVTKLAPAGNSLVYSTYLGGNADDDCWAMKVDVAGSAYVTGRTNSTDFPTEDPYQRRRGGRDVFVTKLATTGRTLVYSTYLGGTGDDAALSIALDQAGSAYVAGYTDSTDFPVLSPYQSDQGGQDAFLTKLDADGDELVYSTYLGGSGGEQAWSVAVDRTGAAYVAGVTASSDFPTRLAPQAALAGGDDVFVTKLTPSGAALTYSTYLGGAGRDMALGVVVDSVGAAYVAGTTASANFSTAFPFLTYQGSEDAFVAKLEERSSPPAPPVVMEVANAWSGRSPIGDAAWVYIKGAGLAETTRTWRDSEIVGGRLPTALDGVSVKINAEDAYVYYVSPTQINVQVPFDGAVGEVPVEVTNAGGKSSFFSVEKEGVAPALFVWFPGTATEGNKYVGAVASEGQQVVYIGKPGLLGPVGLPTRPARPGETVLLFATGCGPTTPHVPPGQVVTPPIPTLSMPVEIRIGGLPAVVAGGTGYLIFAGECQFNVSIPQGVPDGDALVELEIGGVKTQSNIFITVQR